MRTNYDMYNVINPVKVKINDYCDIDEYDDLDAIVIHTPIDEGNEMIAIYDPRKLAILDKLPDFKPFNGELTYKLPFNQIKDTNPYVILGVCKAIKISWLYNPESKLIDELKTKTSLQIIVNGEIAQLNPPVILPKVGDYLLLTDRTKIFEELEKLENIIYNGDFEEEKNSINIHYII